MCSEHKTTKVIICTYNCLLTVTGESEIEHTKQLERVHNVWRWLVKLKDIRSVSGIDVELRYSIPVILSQQ